MKISGFIIKSWDETPVLIDGCVKIWASKAQALSEARRIDIAQAKKVKEFTYFVTPKVERLIQKYRGTDLIRARPVNHHRFRGENRVMIYRYVCSDEEWLDVLQKFDHVDLSVVDVLWLDVGTSHDLLCLLSSAED